MLYYIVFTYIYIDMFVNRSDILTVRIFLWYFEKISKMLSIRKSLFVNLIHRKLPAKLPAAAILRFSVPLGVGGSLSVGGGIGGGTGTLGILYDRGIDFAALFDEDIDSSDASTNGVSVFRCKLWFMLFLLTFNDSVKRIQLHTVTHRSS